MGENTRVDARSPGPTTVCIVVWGRSRPTLSAPTFHNFFLRKRELEQKNTKAPKSPKFQVSLCAVQCAVFLLSRLACRRQSWSDARHPSSAPSP